MSVQLLFRHHTRNIARDNYWVGFVARFRHTVNGKSVCGSEAVEIASIGLSVAEDKRLKDGFSFPIDLRGKYRTDKQVVSYLYIAIEDINRVFVKYHFLESVSLVFAAKGEGSLADLGGSTSVTVFTNDRDDGHEYEIYPGHARACAVRLPLARVENQQRIFVKEGQLRELASYTGDMTTYCQQLNARANAVHVPAPCPGDPISSGLKQDKKPANTNQHATDLAKNLAANLPIGVQTLRSEDGHGEQKIGTAQQATTFETLKPEVAPMQPRPGLIRNWGLGVGVVFIAIVWFVISSRNAPTPPAGSDEGLPKTSAIGPSQGRPATPPNATKVPDVPRRQYQALGVPPTTAEMSSVAPPDVVVPPVPHSGQTITRERLVALGYPEHLAQVKFALASAKVKDWVSVDQARDWLKANKQTAYLPESEQERKQVRSGRRYFNEALEKKIVLGQTTKDNKELQEAIVHLNDFLLENFGSANAHLNLAIAYIESDQSRFALAPAFHTIVFNPDGANGWMQMGLVLAINGEADNGAAALCVTLQIVKYSEKTIGMFKRIEQGMVYDKPNVKEALAKSKAMCPGNGWT